MPKRDNFDAEEGEIADAPQPFASAAQSHRTAERKQPLRRRDFSRENKDKRSKHSRSRSPMRNSRHSTSRLGESSLVNKGHTNVATVDVATSKANSSEPLKDFDIKLSFERDDEAEAERLLEARRRRRKEILQMHATQPNPLNLNSNVRVSSTNDSTVGGSAQTAGTSASSEDDQFALEKEGGEVVNTNTVDYGVSAADYNPNTDSNADDTRHRVAARAAVAESSANQPTAAAKVVPNGVSQSSKADASDDDDFDMFADDDVMPNDSAPRAASLRTGTGVSAAASKMADSWDDPEGYYRTIIGEVLDSRYLVQAFLGQGVFSSVVRAADTQNQDAPVAIKIIRQNEVMYKAGVKERRMLERLQGADPDDKLHVVRLLGSFVHRGHLCLCFELMSLNLREVVRKYGRDSGLSLQAVRVYGMHLFLALDLLRRCHIIHGDIKPDNCFVSEQRNNVKLGDLGSACDISENEITPYLVSRFYRAPEIILGLAYDYAIDMWSVGVTLFELYTGKIMFSGRNNNHMLRLMMEARGQIPTRMLRRGQFWQEHFEDNGGGVMDFVGRSADRLSGIETEQRIVFTKPTIDIKTRILQATPPGSAPEDVQQALRFASLLDRCLELSPDKRILPIDALRHPFFTGK
ncbi:U4/U6 small nuclear ribonucleoprotein prp4 [Coemansia sp. RSA 518]|nr:U4/U6 small nuclear ribonucleoprotein prp4 [Coemansia sp. RSA 518]